MSWWRRIAMLPSSSDSQYPTRTRCNQAVKLRAVGTKSADIAGEPDHRQRVPAKIQKIEKGYVMKFRKTLLLAAAALFALTVGSTTSQLAAQSVSSQLASESVIEIINGKAHATITVEPKPTFYALGNPDTLFQPCQGFTLLASTLSGFALCTADPDAINCFNNWIIQRQKDGWLQSRFDF